MLPKHAESPVRKRAPKVARAEHRGRQVAVVLEPEALTNVFGVDDAETASRLLGQLVNVLQPNPTKPVDAAVINQALALVRDIGPSDATEAMIAVMMVASQLASMDLMRRAAHPDQTPSGRQSYMALGLKAMRTFAQLMETLNHSKGKGVVQRVIVERVSVGPGGQAIVGAVAPRD